MSSIQSLTQKYPYNGKPITYGTSGFRDRAEELGHVFFRMGLLGALRSRAKGSQAVGLMITASHNPEPDNGVKLMDPQGEMLEQSWEAIATQLVNVADEKLQDELSSIAMFARLDVNQPALVFVGRDTRPSSPGLSEASVAGVKAYNGKVEDHGVVSTPMLHYYVNAFNAGVVSDTALLRQSYFERFSSAFKALRKEGTSKGNYTAEVDFDGANGVGALVMESFIQYLADSLKVQIYNSDVTTRGKLNHMCGADYVKTYGKCPEGMGAVKNRRCASVDGDADRIVYFYIDNTDKLHLLDGDRIATLVAAYLKDLLQESGLSLGLGLVQTAYANGNSTKYISESLKVEVAFTQTGVKHLHHKATEFDIGIYFEANGHGTVVFSDSARQLIIKAASEGEGASRRSGEKLKEVMEVINETVGDALSDLFLVETVLLERGWSIQDWELQYTDLPSRLAKVVVKERGAVETEGPECKCLRPEGLQEGINKLVAQIPSARAFVRPSGTEDIVRVYAEAETQEQADSLARQVSCLVYDLAAGIGERPS